ncbi:MAG: ATP-binding protein [Clostridia bacterium]
MTEFYIEGQRALKILERDVQSNTVRQGYIFDGSEGIGKKTAARLFAKMLLCEGEHKPCSVCHSCSMFEAGSHPDVYYLKNSPVKIDDVRDMNSELYIKPFTSKRKVFIVEHADEMNIPAQNAFLKSFEEPPEYAVIILIASSSKKLLPTILSRGTKIPFSPFPEEKIREFVEKKYAITGERGAFLAKYSSGIVGRVIDVAEDEEFYAIRHDMIMKIKDMAGDRVSILSLIEAFGATTRRIPEKCGLYFDIFMGFFSDVSALKNGGRIINSDYKDVIDDFAAKVTGRSARRVVEIAAKVKSELNPSMKYDLWITNMLINCWEEIHGTGNRS